LGDLSGTHITPRSELRGTTGRELNDLKRELGLNPGGEDLAALLRVTEAITEKGDNHQ